MKTERTAEIYKELQELEEKQLQYERVEYLTDSLEEELLYQNRVSKDLNNELLEIYPDDMRLQKILLDKEEWLKQSYILQRDLFQECRENVSEARKKLEDKRDIFREELYGLLEQEKREGGQDENNNNFYSNEAGKII